MFHIAPLVTVMATAIICIVAATEKTVTTTSELQAALDAAVPGDIINVDSGTYDGPFTISTSGTKSDPIVLHTTAQQLKITGGGSGVGLTIAGNYWTVKYLPLSDFDTGILLQGTGIVLESLALTEVNTGVEVQGKENTVKNCAIEAGKLGIRVGGDNTVLESNSVRGSDPAIFAASGTCCGKFEWNVASGKIKVEGANYQSDGNVFVEGDAAGIVKGKGTPKKEPPHSFWSTVTNFFQSFFG